SPGSNGRCAAEQDWCVFDDCCPISFETAANAARCGPCSVYEKSRSVPVAKDRERAAGQLVSQREDFNSRLRDLSESEGPRAREPQVSSRCTTISKPPVPQQNYSDCE